MFSMIFAIQLDIVVAWQKFNGSQRPEISLALANNPKTAVQIVDEEYNYVKRCGMSLSQGFKLLK